MLSPSLTGQARIHGSTFTRLPVKPVRDRSVRCELVDRFNETDPLRGAIYKPEARSFRGATAWWRARNPYSPAGGYGFRARGQEPAPRNDAEYDSKFKIAELARVPVKYDRFTVVAPDLSSPGLAGRPSNPSDAGDTGSPAFAGDDRNLF